MSATAELGHQPSLVIGLLTVEPSFGQVEGPTRRQHLEPRVMQVLVALIEAGGSTVTRPDLIEWCWNGRAVSDDAINRVIVTIRKVAQQVALGSVKLTTIPKIGYRLTVAAPMPAGVTLRGSEMARV